MQSLAETGAGVLGGGVSVGAVAWWMFRNLVEQLQNRIATQESELKKIRDNELEHLDQRVAGIENACVRHKSETKLDTLIGSVSRMEGQVSTLCERTATVVAKIDAQGVWLDNLNEAHRGLADEVHAHIGSREVHHG